MAGSSGEILREVDDYYSAKILEHGLSPRGVDWNGEESQSLRFCQLMKIVDNKETFSINDLGCGYGALIDSLEKNPGKYRYCGIDISAEMIRSAKDRYGSLDHVHFDVAATFQNESDYSVASGIFNVKLKHDADEWWSYMTTTLDMMNEKSTKGFAFNCLTKYSDADKMRDYLYYADPCQLFNWCKTRYSKQVALLHDYGLYEFTILVRK